MKKLLIKISSIAFAAFLFQSCAKEPSFDYPEDTVGSSKIVYFPSVNIKGDKLVIMNQGTAFTDPGVTSLLNGQPLAFTTAGSVDINKPGIYNLTYSATTPAGYSASDYRTVAVISNDATVTDNNFGGVYTRTSNGVNSTWTKVARGVYSVDNPGGAGVGVGFKVTVVNYEGNKIAIPRQIAFDPSIPGNNDVRSSSETYNAAASPVSYSWIFLAGGYGTALRTFIKQ
jgi:Domain of unknown function (DUF5011)